MKANTVRPTQLINPRTREFVGGLKVTEGIGSDKNVGCAVNCEPPIHALISSFGQSVGELESAIIRLGNKMEAVLLPENPPAPCETNGQSIPQPVMSSVENRLNGLDYSVRSLARRVEDLIERARC